MNLKQYSCIALIIINIFAASDIFASKINSKNTSWPMYQYDAAHTGYVPINLNVKFFKFSWEALVGRDSANKKANTVSLGRINPVAVEGNYVVAARNYYPRSLYVFNIANGHKIWSKTYEKPSINPPSIYKGIVYIQTVNNESSDTAIYGYHVISGNTLFKTPTRAQWENYLSPTIYKDNVYTDGGYYGGMYSFDRKNGKTVWFKGLAMYDMWTPAVNDKYAISYTYGKLNILDRITGDIVENIVDPNYRWHGYSTNFAPVILNNNNVAGIQSGYLTIFDIKNKNISWSDGPGYIGQPTYDGKYIYASQNGGLVAANPKNGKVIWKFFKDNEDVQKQIIATKNLIFFTTQRKTYAISKKKHSVVWSYPEIGQLSLGRGKLFIANYNGKLIAIRIAR